MKNAKPTIKQLNNGYSSLRGYSNLKSISRIIVRILARAKNLNNKISQANNKLAYLVKSD